MKKIVIVICSWMVSNSLSAQSLSTVWVPDKGDGTYQNPVINADYSDPDVIRVGADYYLIASSFNHVPGLPILHSKDLVNWQLIGHALTTLTPADHFTQVQHGGGVWAPSIRYHQQEFWIYYPDPDYGIYLIKSKKIEGPWTTPVLVAPGKGLIDPCPLWDDNGKLYLVHAYAGSRAGIKSVLVVNELSADGSTVITDPVLVYDGHETDPTVEGPKFYKRNGYYYIFAPAGGVSTGWQLVLRSKNVYGPYERKVVMDQGQTAVNGPHQGAWVDTRSGENWFLHFQDKNAYGRVVHLQPMRWVNDWPVIGNDIDGDGKGEPVMLYKKPNVGGAFPLQTPVASDEFENRRMGLQWQWQANPAGNPAFIYIGHLRLFAAPLPDSFKNYWTVPSLLLQKFTADSFTATTAIFFHPKKENDRAGLIVFGSDYAIVSLSKKPTGHFLSLSVCIQADKGAAEKVMAGVPWTGDTAYCRVTVKPGGICHFSYSSDNIHYHSLGDSFVAKPGRWVGAKLGIFCSSAEKTNDAGYADFDWFRISPAE